MLSWTQTVNHQVDHGDADHRFTAGGQGFVVLAEAPIFSQPREGALDDPSFVHHHKTVDRRSFDDFDDAAAGLFGPADELAGVSAVGPDELQTMKAMRQSLQNQSRAIAILDIGCVNDDRQHEAQRVNHQMPLAPRDFLAGIESAIPPFSAVFTDCESMIAAEGVGLRPTLRRTFSRRRS